MQKQLLQFISRWAANSLGLAASTAIGIITLTGGVRYILISGLLLALLNALVKPLLIIISLPLIAISLGFFLIVINGIVMYLLSLIYSPLEIDNFWMAMVAGIIIGLVNYIVTITYERFVADE